MAKKSRIPSTTVDLILILGRILRDHLKLEITETECWTFEHVANWSIPPIQPPPEIEAWEHLEYLYIPKHEMSVHLGSGYCWARHFEESGNPAKLELRVRCEMRKWVPAGLSYWDFQLWIKDCTSVARHHFLCWLDYGTSRQIEKVVALENEKIFLNPPRKIAFWKPEEAQTS